MTTTNSTNSTNNTKASNKIALITGANHGLGFATARLLGQAGVRGLAGARDAAKGEMTRRPSWWSAMTPT